jgi:hypothetical protein
VHPAAVAASVINTIALRVIASPSSDSWLVSPERTDGPGCNAAAKHGWRRKWPRKAGAQGGV